MDSPDTAVVKSEDRLLVWYGTGTEADILKNIAPKVSHNADEYNHKDDPKSCSTNRATGIFERLQELLHHE